MIQAVIFDCDGTLVDSEQAHYFSWCHAIEKQGGELSLEEYIASYAGNSAEKNAKLLANKIGHENIFLQIAADKHEHFNGLQKSGLPAIAATVNFVHQLGLVKKEKHLKMAVASAAHREEILRNLKQHQIEHYFDEIISGIDDLSSYDDPEGVNKPKPYIYLHAAKLLQVEPHQCMAIEDSHPGVKAACSAGCYTIAIPNFYTKGHDFSMAHRILHSLADYTVEEFLT